MNTESAAEAAELATTSLMHRYANVPMDLPDVYLVPTTELNPGCDVFTTDGDFRFYRRFNRQVIPRLCPNPR